jgi:hypothetical protein
MATYSKRKGARGVRWTARVRLVGREVTKTFGTKAAASSWARAQEDAIETGAFRRTTDGVIFADLVDSLVEHRKTIRRPLGKTATHVLARLNDKHGLESVSSLTVTFWRRHALDEDANEELVILPENIKRWERIPARPWESYVQDGREYFRARP